jgi:soluble lytic murein transglycosylase-like protein
MVRKTMVYSFVIASMLYSLPSQARDCGQHPIYCQILENSPRIDEQYAFKLSNIIFKASRKHNIPSNLLTAILRQESNYKVSAKNGACGVLRGDYKKEACIWVDFGISQINYRTARSYNMDFYKLLNDVEYSVNAGAEVLAWFRKKYASKEDRWWVRYNCGTKPSVYRDSCQKYYKDVKRWI